MSKGDKTLWDLAIKQVEESEANEQRGEEKSVVFVGSKNCGKTSIILRFLDRDEIPKPTTALEYTFGRKAKGHNLAKDVAHIWELGGGTWLSKLVEIPVNADNLMNTSLILALDLSKPEEIWITLETWIKQLRSRIDNLVAEIRVSEPDIKDRLKQMTWARLGEVHVDKDMLDPFPIPLVIIGTKYDIYQDFDSEKRKVICKTLRFVAHMYGAQLLFTSVKLDAMMNKARAVISNLVFGTTASKTVQLEHNKPLLIPAGNDSLQQIGSPPLADGDLGRVTAKTPFELWKTAYTAFFPQQNIVDPSLVEDPAKDPQYAESTVDATRVQKNEELERYRRLAERRMREAARMAEGLA